MSAQVFTFNPFQVEGVTYRKFIITFRLKSGKRVRWIRYAPLEMFAREQLVRELEDRDIGPDDVVPRSCSIREVG